MPSLVALDAYVGGIQHNMKIQGSTSKDNIPLKKCNYAWQTVGKEGTLDRLLHQLDERREQLLQNLPSDADKLVEESLIEEWMSLLRERDRLTRLKVKQSNHEIFDKYMKDLRSLLEKIHKLQGRYVKPTFKQALDDLYQETVRYIDNRNKRISNPQKHEKMYPDVLIVASPEYDLVIVHSSDEDLPRSSSPAGSDAQYSTITEEDLLANSFSSDCDKPQDASSESELPDVAKLSLNTTPKAFKFINTDESNSPFQFIGTPPRKSENSKEDSDSLAGHSISSTDQVTVIIPQGPSSIDSGDDDFLSADSSVNSSDNEMTEKVPFLTPTCSMQALSGEADDTLANDSSESSESNKIQLEQKSSQQKGIFDYTPEKPITFKIQNPPVKSLLPKPVSETIRTKKKATLAKGVKSKIPPAKNWQKKSAPSSNDTSSITPGFATPSRSSLSAKTSFTTPRRSLDSILATPSRQTPKISLDKNGAAQLRKWGTVDNCSSDTVINPTHTLSEIAGFACSFRNTPEKPPLKKRQCSAIPSRALKS